MAALMNYVPSQMSQILAIKDKFVEVSKQSDEKLSTVIEAAKDFRSGMEPLKKVVDQLQIRVKNLQYCIEGLHHVQNFYKTGREVEQIIIQGPAVSLTNYLKAMDRIKDSLIYFDQNNTEHLEYTRLTTLLSNGLKSLHKYFEEILNQSFTPLPPDALYKLVEKEDDISLDGTKADEIPAKLIECDSVSEESIHIMQEISTWLRKTASVVTSAAMNSMENKKSYRHLVQLFQTGGINSASNEGYPLPQSLIQYCEFRQASMRVALVTLREYQKSLDKNISNARSRPATAGSQLNISTSSRRRGLKAVGIVWDANSRRGVSNDIRDVDDLDSEHYATSLSAFLVLIERERLLLDRLKLTMNSHEAHLAYGVICHSALADLMTEGGSYVRLMGRVIGRGEFYMIVSLLTIMRRFIDLSPSFVETLKVVNAVSQPMIDLVNRIRAQIKATFDAFLHQLQPGTGSSHIPPDATVHELTSNVLLFLEKLIDYEITVGTALTWEEVKVAPEATFNYLTTVTSKPKMARSAFGQYIVRVITTLVTNIDKKSEAYSDDLLRVIFQMNNLRYIITNLKRTGLESVLNDYDNTAVDKLTKVLSESKQIYTRACMRFINLPSPAFISQLAQRKQMDSKERSQLKDLWTGVNQGFTSLLKQHSQLSIPDRELREDLRVCLSREMVPHYQAFHDHSLRASFTSRREKYIKLSPPEFQARLDQLFSSAPTQVTLSR